MSTHAYTEAQLVEQPAIGLFAELGWPTVSALEKTFGATGALRRETEGAVVLVSRLRAALERLNPTLPPEVMVAGISGVGPVLPGGEMTWASKIPIPMTRHGSGHKTRQESGVLASKGLFTSVNTANEPDIYADI